LEFSHFTARLLLILSRSAVLEFRLKKKERQPKRTLATDSGENEGEKENPSTPCMNSEALKKFRQAAYELLVKAKDATSLANGCSDDD
jgi:hypothetical protein